MEETTTKEEIEEAIEIIKEENKASATLFQRRMGITFAKAANILFKLEDL